MEDRSLTKEDEEDMLVGYYIRRLMRFREHFDLSVELCYERDDKSNELKLDAWCVVKVRDKQNNDTISYTKGDCWELAFDGAYENLKDYCFEKFSVISDLYHVFLKHLKNNEATGCKHGDGACT